MGTDWKNIVGTITSQFLNIGINKKDQFGKTSLHAAAYKSNPQLVQELLSLGANVNSLDKFNSTPLHLAAWKNVDESHYEVAKILLKNGADPNAKDKQGQTPIYFALWRGNSNFVKLLLSFKADVGGVNEDGSTCLFSAAKSNKNWEVLQLLMDLGFRADHRCVDGKTPLHYACDNENLNTKMVRCLLRNGADANAADDEGITPLVKLIQTYEKLGTKIMKSNLNLVSVIMEHTDFNRIYVGKNVLDFSYKGSMNDLWYMILGHFAKLQSLCVPVNAEFLNIISATEKYDQFYYQCKEELERAKSVRIKNTWLTFYNILVDDRRKLKNYSGNVDFLFNFFPEFMQGYGNGVFLIYAVSMIGNYAKGFKRRKLFDECSIILSNRLPIFNPNHLIIRDIFDCILSNKDLAKFCNRENELYSSVRN